MRRILNLRSSVSGDASSSRTVAAVLLERLQEANASEEVSVVVRDLNLNPVPHLSGETLASLFGGEPSQGGALSDTLIDEIMQADIWVIEAPMYNLGIPSSLKAWIDHIVRAKKTFAYTAEGPKGLIPEGKIVYVVSARGGVYVDTPASSVDFVSSYLKAIFQWLGVQDVRLVAVEGTNMQTIGVEAARAKAIASLSALV
jgi:FMN-dependent NADH-azoreductase